LTAAFERIDESEQKANAAERSTIDAIDGRKRAETELAAVQRRVTCFEIAPFFAIVVYVCVFLFL
jgi:hypothetical protein